MLDDLLHTPMSDSSPDDVSPPDHRADSDPPVASGALSPPSLPPGGRSNTVASITARAFTPLRLDDDDIRETPPAFRLDELSTRLSLLMLAGVADTQRLAELLDRRPGEVSGMLSTHAFRNRMDYIKSRLTPKDERSADWMIHERIRDGIMPNGEAAPPPIMYAASKDVISRTDPAPPPPKSEHDDPNIHIHISGTALEQLGAGLIELKRAREAVDVTPNTD